MVLVILKKLLKMKQKFKKKCRECGGFYDPKDKYIKIKLNHKDIEAIEDIFFCINSEEKYIKMRPKLLKVWKQICTGEEKWCENSGK